MPEMKTISFESETIQKNTELMLRLGERYHTDPAFRRSVASGGRAALAEMGLELPAGVDVKVVANTDERLYLPMPPNPNKDLSDQSLVSAFGGTDTAGTSGSVSTVSTFPGACIFTALTASTLGSIDQH